MLKCMVEWSRELYITPTDQSRLVPDDEATEAPPSDLPPAADVTVANSGPPNSNSAYQFEEIKHQKDILEHGIDL